MTAPEERVVPMRLQKFLARAGAASRRGSENLMTAGRVRVNGEVVTELGSKVDPNVDVVTVDGREVRITDTATFIMLNKPAGYVTTMHDPGGRPCVAELVPSHAHPGLFPVGRLDRDTTGLLLFTTDGEAAQALLHPSFEKDKHYLALIEGRLGDREWDELEGGIVLDDGPCARARGGVRPARLRGPHPGAEGRATGVLGGGAHHPRGTQAPGEAYASGGGARGLRAPPGQLRPAPSRLSSRGPLA